MDQLPESLFTIPEVAKRLHVSVPTVRRWIRTGVDGHQLGAFKVGGSWRISEAAILEFLQPINQADQIRTPRERSRDYQEALDYLADHHGIKIHKRA